jgi:hypothetical protein
MVKQKPVAWNEEEALKLADELKDGHTKAFRIDVFNEASDMIRNLVAELGERTNENTDLRVLIATKFAELDKQGEPFGWHVPKTNLFYKEKPKGMMSKPLYTAPRELSDEEIISLAKSFQYKYMERAVDFAKAILKKASEK